MPASATNVVAIAAGYQHALALRVNGTIVAWGNQAIGATNVPAVATNPPAVAVAAGNQHSAAVRSDGTVIAWGNNTYGQTNVPPMAADVLRVRPGLL